MTKTNTAIFLGAGASKAEGAPLQGELFREYFSSPHFKSRQNQMNHELAAFFQQMFQIDVRRQTGAMINYPTFEEVLGLTDLAILRKEAFRNFELENRNQNSARLRFISQYLVFLVADTLDTKLRRGTQLHRQLVQNLRESKFLQHVVFVSTNYDILIDNALVDEHRYGSDLDYAVDFRNFNRPSDWERPRPERSVLLAKPHGSLNWLLCPTCNELELTPKEKSVATLITASMNARCRECQSTYVPLIVPPSFYKDLSNIHLSRIWNRTELALRNASHIVFCGYSFPDADIHIKYLLKRAQTNRTTKLRLTVINNHEGKNPQEKALEEARFLRFLGPAVKYTDLSFQDFVEDPMAVLKG